MRDEVSYIFITRCRGTPYLLSLCLFTMSPKLSKERTLSPKEKHVLRNEGHRSAQGRKGKFSDRITIDEKSPILWVVKTEKQ